jgi:ABC-type nitrate/sulfonate/bicarbonate transport system permease component
MTDTTPSPTRAAARLEPARVRRELRRRRWRAAGPIVLGVTGFVALLAIWQLYSEFAPAERKDFLSPPTQVLPQFFANFGYQSFWAAIGHTLWALLASLALSAVAALVLGVVIGSSAFLRKATHTTIEFLRPIPSVGLIPIAALVYGPRLGSELLVVIYGCFWLIIIQALYGIADIDRVADETVRTMQLSWLQRVRTLVVPTMLPYYITGMRLAATVALILAVSTELLIGTPGLGRAIAQAQLNGSMTSLLALVLAAGLLGIVINLVARFVERRVLFWHPSIRTEAGQ